MNQGWNHAGNDFAALLAMAVVSTLGLNALFYSVAAASLLAAASVLLIRESDLDERVGTGLTGGEDEDKEVKWSELFRNRTVLFLFLSIFMFHLANAPILPAVALYVKKLGRSDDLMTATVLTAQVVMVPVICKRWMGWAPEFTA